MRTVFVLAGAALLAASMGVQAAWQRHETTAPRVPAVRYLRSPEVARRVALSYDALVADLYWMRALQEFGGTRLASGGDKSYESLYPFLDITTSLDPQFNAAYRFGAIFLSEPPPGGPGRTDQAIALLRKGIAHNPRRWEYYLDIGFVYYWWRQDYLEAARWFERGAAIEGAPWWLRSMAATTLATGGDLRSSRFMWQRLRDSADSDWLRQDAARRLQQIDALERIDVLTAAVDRARAAGVEGPWSWALLFSRGLLTTVPVDPAGVPYVIDLRTGSIAVSRDSPLWPMPSAAPPPTVGTAVTEPGSQP